MKKGCPYEWRWLKRGDAYVNVTAKGKLRPGDTNLVSRVLENEKTLGTRLNLIGFYDFYLQIKLFSILFKFKIL